MCDCGNECTVVSDKLRNKSSCGCDTKERRSKSLRVDLTGRRFGRLVVTRMIWDAYPTKSECICDCGNKVIVRSTGLTSNKTQSCGCLQKEKTSQATTKDWTGVTSDYGISFINRSTKNARGQWLWDCECGVCGGIFKALPAKIMNGHVTSCGCRVRSSKEDYIRTLLEELSLPYKEQYRIEECKDKHTLPFDFAIFLNDDIILVEYDGEQHFYPVECFGGEEGFQRTKSRDIIKNEYCANNNITLIRLPYTLSNQEIKEILTNIKYP